MPWPQWIHPGAGNGIMDYERRIFDSGYPYDYSGGEIVRLK